MARSTESCSCRPCGCCSGEVVTPAVKSVVRKPLGKVYSSKGLLAMIKRSRIGPRRIIAIGDATGSFLVASGVKPAVWIYDGKERRKPVTYTLPIPTHIVANPAGKITFQLRSAIDDVLRAGKGRIFVRGEEDMATLFVIAKAKAGSLILYGQPNKGVVAVKADVRMRDKADNLLCMLE